MRNTFRYDTSGTWFKGNTHIHSTASDGGKTVSELAGIYSKADYDFIFITDHWISSNVSEAQGDTPILLLDGIELDGKDPTGSYFHLICLGKTEGIKKEDGLEYAMMKAKEQNAIIILAHPYWSGNSLEDAIRGEFDGVEVYNHVCNWLNGKSNGHTHWDAMLQRNPETLCFASDDTHLRPEHPGWNGGWISINTSDLSNDSVLSAIRRGNFYSSCGPSFTSISCDDGFLHIDCSEVQFIRLIGPAYYGWRTGSFNGELLNNASIEIPQDWKHMYVELEDKYGKKAWSNTLFVTDDSGSFAGITG